MPASPHPPTQSPSIAALLARAALAPRQSHKSLTLWPLVWRSDAPAPAGPAYVPLVDALEAGELVVDEVGDAGSVSHVSVANRGERPVLVLFGEELRGAKQNRIANASFLVPGQSELVIDVSCVEQGRWERQRGARFEAAARVVSHRLRRQMAADVAKRKAAGGERFAADQGEVWDGVRQRLYRARVDSPTAAYEDYVQSRRSDVDAICSAFRARPGQMGFVAAIGDEVVGAEFIGRPDVFRRVFPRLLQGYAIDAADLSLAEAARPKGLRGPRFAQPEEFLEALAGADAASSPSLGAGEDLRLGGGVVAGCALVHGQVVHMTAFPAEAP